jgi:hypothetical protein
MAALSKRSKLTVVARVLGAPTRRASERSAVAPHPRPSGSLATRLVNLTPG